MKRTPGPPAVPEFDVAFVDGSNVKVVVLEQAFAVSAKYGKLTVPVAELKRVELGFRYPDGVETRLLGVIDQLGASDFADREAAAQELLALKQYAGPLLKRAMKDADPERAARATALLKAVRKDVPADRVDAKDFDTIETAEFTLRGRLDVATFKARTKQFGEAEIRLAEVKQVRSNVAADTSEGLVLDAATYSKLNWSAWFDTGIDVPDGLPLEIVCSGTIDQWPQEPGRYTSGPAGNGNPAPNQQGNVRVLAQVAPPGRAVVGFNGNLVQRGLVLSGAVVGKLGPTGQPFVVGASLNLPRTPTPGRLFLQIAPSHWNNDNCTGSYKVQVKTGE